MRRAARSFLRSPIGTFLIPGVLALGLVESARADDVWNGSDTTGLGWRNGPVAIGSAFCGKILCIHTGGGLGNGTGIWMTRENPNGQQALGILSNLGAGAWGPMTKAGDFMLLVRGPANGDPQAGLVIAPWNSQASGLRIAENGHVGIGTPDPGTFRLAVNGSVRAKEVVVETGWADFVFEDGYRLMPLGEVEQHIAEHGHLPDIPSAGEIAENGVHIGAMQARLLQKVEELTLYMIALEKENGVLRHEMKRLAHQVGEPAGRAEGGS